MTLNRVLGDLFGQWVASREAQVRDLLAAGIDQPAEIAARLDMTVEAAAAYLLRAAAGAEVFVTLSGGDEEITAAQLQQSVQEKNIALGRLLPPGYAAGVPVPPRPPGGAIA